MGLSNTKQRLCSKLQSRIDAWSRTTTGGRILSCSFERWAHQGFAAESGFHDMADYNTPREDFRTRGFLLRPDVTDGRYIKVEKVSCNRLVLEEKISNHKISVEIQPCFTSGKIPHKLNPDHRMLVLNYVQHQTNRDGVAVVGCHGNLAVVQILDRKSCHVPEFYFIDVQRQICLGKFASKDAELLWYECYISPDKNCILLRPDVNTHIWSPGDIVKTHIVNKIRVMLMRKFADSGGHLVAFDNRHGNQFIIRAKDKDIQIFDLYNMEVILSNRGLDLPANIRQIKSSPSGSFIAVRCAYPAYSMEFETNSIVVLLAQTLNVLFSIDARGPYWPISEVVNQQVFPRFSACETGIAVMRHKPSYRKVSVYKLPVLMISLQHFCRRTIRSYVNSLDVEGLPLPKRIKQYLNYEVL